MTQFHVAAYSPSDLIAAATNWLIKKVMHMPSQATACRKASCAYAFMDETPQVMAQSIAKDLPFMFGTCSDTVNRGEDVNNSTTHIY